MIGKAAARAALPLSDTELEEMFEYLAATLETERVRPLAKVHDGLGVLRETGGRRGGCAVTEDYWGALEADPRVGHSQTGTLPTVVAL